MASIAVSSRTERVNRVLTLVFAGLMVVQLGYLLSGLASLPVYYQRVTTQTVEPVMLYGEVLTNNELIAQEAVERGLSLAQYALYRVVFQTVSALIPTVIALVIIWRARRQWFAWFTAFAIVYVGLSNLAEQISVGRLIPFEVLGANDLFWFLILLFLLLFPNGQVVPRRAGWLAVGLVAYHFFIQVGTVVAYVAPEFAVRMRLPNWGDPLYVAPVLLNFLIVLACQIYRFRYVSNRVERQQTKWFVYGLVVIVVLILASFLIGKQGGFLEDLVANTLWIPLPIALAQAILRHRLWDIDLIIRRTLQYSLLSGLLALTYFGLIIVLQSAFTALTGQRQNDFITVASTLAIAALFAPLRRRVQDVIDRRFYRKKYDAAKTLAAFAATVRDETDLDKLTASLVSVVQETMQPESVSLWLKDASRNAKSQPAEGGRRREGKKE